MYWPDTNTGVDIEPARKPVASAVRKFFTEGGAGQPPTVPGGDWFNQITNELLNVLAAAGIDPSKADDDQLLQAIQSISNGEGAYEALSRTYAAAGYYLRPKPENFKNGGTLTSAADVLLDLASGKAYSSGGPFPEFVAAGTDPSSGGYIDRSNRYGPRRFSSAQEMTDFIWMGVGDVCKIASYVGATGFGGGTWVAANSASVTANGVTKLASANASVTLVLQHSGEVNLCQVGAVAGADVTNIINVLNDDPSIHSIYGSRLAFVCSATVFLKKNFIGRGASFDFSTSPEDSDSFSAYNSPDFVQIADFKVSNSKRVALIGNGVGAQIERVRAFNSVKQGINWSGDDWEISLCQVNGVTQEFGIANGGNSRRFKISKCNVFNVVGAGSFELGYQFSDCEITGCVANDGFAGLQIFPGAKLAGTHTTMRNVRIVGFTSRNMSNAHVHIKNDFVGTITLNDVTLESIAIQGEGAATGIRATNLALLRLLGGSIKNVGGYAIELLTGVGETELNNVDFDGLTGPIPFIFTASDNVAANDCYFKNGNAIVGANSGHNFSKILLTNCRTKNIVTPHINITELSIKNWQGNDFVTPFTTADQFLGYYQAGYRRHYTNPQPAGHIGLVCTTSGTAGTTAVFKSFGPINA